MKHKTLAMSIFMLLTACRSPQPAAKPEILVAAAADLTRALPDLAADFQTRSGVAVKISFGSSGMLTQQIEHGAPFQAFLSADREYVAQLARDGKVAGSRRVYARGRLVMWSRDIQVSGVKDIISSRITRVALANPDHAPYGRAARQALQHAGVWTPMQAKFVLADSIRHSLEMAESGNADLAFSAQSLLVPGQGFSYLVPDELYDPLDQEAAVLQMNKDAERFVEYLGSEPAQKILSKYGFLLPK